MKIGFYAGSFDPFTTGHLHVVKKSIQVFDKVIIGIGENPEKSRRFDNKLMKQAIEEVLKDENIDDKVEVIIYDGLSVDAAKEYDASFMIRGIRNGIDYNQEENLAVVNEEISGLDTIYFRAGILGSTSSSMVMMLLNSGKNVDRYLPKSILKFITKKNH